MWTNSSGFLHTLVIFFYKILLNQQTFLNPRVWSKSNYQEMRQVLLQAAVQQCVPSVAENYRQLDRGLLQHVLENWQGVASDADESDNTTISYVP